jgi:hypothetical protein
MAFQLGREFGFLLLAEKPGLVDEPLRLQQAHQSGRSPCWKRRSTAFGKRA